MKSQFGQRVLRSAGEARTHTASEMLNAHTHHQLLLRLSHLAVGKALSSVFPSSLNGLPFWRGGYEQVVYASDDEVRKIISTSLTFRPSQAKEEAKKAQSLHDLCSQYMDRHWLQTYFEPVKVRKLSAVMAVQPKLMPAHVFVNPEAVATAAGANYEADELDSMHESIVGLHAETGFYPDILGSGNILLSAKLVPRQLTIVDTLPVTPKGQERVIREIGTTVQETTRQKLSIWKEAVDTIRSHSSSREVVYP